VDVHVDVRPLPMTSLASYRETRGLDAMLRYLVASRQVTDERAAAFLADLEDRDLKGGFLATMVMYVASGRRTSSRVPTKE
jgi:hypothetical protein